MITAEMAGKALAAFDMTFGGRCDDAHLRMWTNKMRAALEAIAPMIRAQALEEAAQIADLWATDHPRQFGDGDPAAAIRAIKEEQSMTEQSALRYAGAARAGVRPVTAPKFKVGDPVYKVTGDYRFPGEVRAVFTTRGGEVRYVVECVVPEVAGMLHIYSEKNLAARFPALAMDGEYTSVKEANP